MNNLSERSAVFVGCARNCEAHLDKVLENIGRLAALYAKAAFVFVESDSQDGTKAQMLQWLAPLPSGTLLQLDGLAATEPRRTARLALARNNALAYLRESPYADYDDLVVMDFDEANSTPLDREAFTAAVEFLHADGQTFGVFTNSRPVYYDIWALRHPNWCPSDCWAEVLAAHDVSPDEAKERFVYARQVAIDRHQSPIEVASGFGGLGIYRLAKVLPHQYVGITSSGSEVCEHVSLNLALCRSGRLFIFPALQNLAPRGHLRPNPVPARELRLEQDGRSCVLLAPPDHRLDTYRAAPLYDRRLPLLSRLVAAAAPGFAMIDVGANIGDTVALCRMAGCDAPFIAIEPSARYFPFLEANQWALPELFKNVRTMRAFIGAGSEPLTLVENAGTARAEVNQKTMDFKAANAIVTLPLGRVTDQDVSLIKTDTDGYDAAIIAGSLEFLRRARPVIWAEAEASSHADEQLWKLLCVALAESHPYICVFDNFGFLITHGAVAEKQVTLLDIIGYARRHKACDANRVGLPKVYYADVAFFPEIRMGVYTAFVDALIEGRV